MFDSLIKAIQEGVTPHAVGDYYSRPLSLPPAEPTVKPLEVHTLGAIADWWTWEGEDGLAIHVESPTSVYVLEDAQGRHMTRNYWIHADASPILGRGFEFGQWMDIETFIIRVQAQFVQTEGRDRLLAVVGNLESGQAITIADDGVTQQAAVRSGVRRLSSEEMPNPVILKPWRSFPEIEQPESPYVFRLQQSDKGVKAALFESGGGMWKLEAMQRIKSYLLERLSEVQIIA